MIDLEEIDESRGGTYFPSNRRTSRSLMRRPFVRDACAQPTLASPFPPASASSDRHLISDQTTLIILKGSTLSDTVGLEADEVLTRLTISAHSCPVTRASIVQLFRLACHRSRSRCKRQGVENTATIPLVLELKAVAPSTIVKRAKSTGSGSSPHRELRRCGGHGTVNRMRKGTGEVSVNARFRDRTRRTAATAMCAVALGLNKRHGWLESPRCEPSRCPLTAVTMLDACIAGVWGNDLAGRTHWVSPTLLGDRSYHQQQRTTRATPDRWRTPGLAFVVNLRRQA